MGEGLPLYAQRRQRGIAELAEAPLVRIRYEADRLRSDDAVRLSSQREVGCRIAMRYEQSISNQRVVQPAFQKTLVVTPVGPVNLAI
jgi:hypothetical protein